ncbi:EAL domain-containing protein [Rugamonas sp. CCM 8940]|uniref:EAL domain-containing protein n=1 Tax=Rugamonas sp. CCM 8940 TaxID=2765359 RepID=UPI0018F2AFF1|nr:EAL domain-containing protein [Rugamonas sp. CCM 8940]MBJ7311508.1 EAL domain-containing protein [Rugamonas sp. CCM 8940]
MSVATPTILIVDDEAQNRRLLAVLLRPEGYQTESAASGEEALSVVAHSAPDLILLDIMMPGLDGYQIASILKANPATANIPIIMVTAHGERSARLAGLEAGAEEFLTKPVDRTELWLRVRNLLRLKAFGDLQEHSFVLEQQVAARTADLQRFRTAMDATADAIMLVSRATMRFLEVNASSCKMLGYTRAEMLALGPVAVGAITGETLEQVYDTVIAGQTGKTLSEACLHCKDGSLIQVEVSRQAMPSGSDWIIVSVVRDITERKQAQQRLQHQANHDALSGLPNRTFFYETLRKTIALAGQQGWKVAVMFIDLDHFKNVNDTLGHAIGDELLIHFSNRLTTCVRARDTVGRLGGDEFGLILVMQQGHQGAANVATKIRDALHPPFDLQGYEVIMTASIGITIYPDDGSDPDALIKYADTAMYQAKHTGRNSYRFFTAQMNVDVLQRQDLESALRKAIENEEFELHYQPKVSLTSGALVGLEALLRWARPGHGLVGPAQFIPVLEESGLIVRVGAWVIKAACRQIKEWQLTAVGPVQVSVNVAGRQFIEGDLEADVARALADHDLPPGLLELELTETSLMLNTERTIACLRNLRQLGVKVSIDDFGTGYSSLAYLRRFPIDKLKIDIAFIRDVTSNPDDAAIVRAIITMAHSLNLEVIAEGVETPAQQAYLLRHQCDQIQGYLLSPPLPAALISDLIVQRKTLDRPAAPDMPRQTLLIVDDDPFMRELLASELGGEQYRVLLAQSGAQAFETLAQNEVQVILCDQSMPEMEGTVFLSKVKAMYPDTFRIVLSGETNLEDMMAAVNRGTVDRFYTKPWDREALLSSIRQAFLHPRLGSATASPDVIEV